MVGKGEGGSSAPDELYLNDLPLARPPSFAESQFATIIRRQRRRTISLPASRRLEESQSVDFYSVPGVNASPSARRRRHCLYMKTLHPFLPSELESNIQLVDEAFPKITVDLIFVQAELSPVVTETIRRKLSIPIHRFFLACPSATSKYTLHDFGDPRIIIDDM